MTLTSTRNGLHQMLCSSYIDYTCRALFAVVHKTESTSEVKFHPSIGLARPLPACVEVNKKKSLHSNYFKQDTCLSH